MTSHHLNISTAEYNRQLRLTDGPSGFRRIVNVVSLKNERLDIAQQIRGAAVEALKEHFLPPLRKLLPAAAALTTLHGAGKIASLTGLQPTLPS